MGPSAFLHHPISITQDITEGRLQSLHTQLQVHARENSVGNVIATTLMPACARDVLCLMLRHGTADSIYISESAVLCRRRISHGLIHFSVTQPIFKGCCPHFCLHCQMNL